MHLHCKTFKKFKDDQPQLECECVLRSELGFVTTSSALCIPSRAICHNLADLIRVAITQLSLPIKTFPALCALFGLLECKEEGLLW